MTKPEETTANREALLTEYRAGAELADECWEEYMKTESSQSFGNYLAANRVLSAVYMDLVGMGMSLEDIRGE